MTTNLIHLTALLRIHTVGARVGGGNDVVAIIGLGDLLCPAEHDGQIACIIVDVVYGGDGEW